MCRKLLAGLFIVVAIIFVVHFSYNNENVIRSIYVGNCVNIEKILMTLKEYDANAVVIDVKDDKSQLFPNLPIPTNEKNKIKTNNELNELFNTLKKKGIYTIARIVAFKEFIRDDLCMKDDDGSLLIDKEKSSWMNPHNEKAQQYLEEICEAAAKIGFDEIQLDYIRFSPYFKMEKEDRSRIDVINAFIKRVLDVVHRSGAKLSVCVFGCTIEGSVDTPEKEGQTEKSSIKLGQDFEEIAQRCDFICPMIYPACYPKGTPRGIKDPDLEPYKVITTCMDMCTTMMKKYDSKINKGKDKKRRRAIVRPYLQAFTAKWLKKYMKYDKKAVKEQIRALYDSGYHQWGLFNMAGKYPTE